MVPVIPVAGSPLIPTDAITIALIVFAAVLVLVYLGLLLRNQTLPLRARLKAVSRIALIILFFGAAGMVSLTAYWLLPQPNLIQSQVVSKEPLSLDQPLVFQFDRPVSRQKLTKTITPDVPGVWVFEDPLYRTHLMRRVVFYPQVTLNPDTEYTIQLGTISNTSGLSPSVTQTYRFRTSKQPQSLTAALATVVKTEPVTKLGVPAYLQQHALSCELSSLRMALAYRGNTVSEDTLLGQVGVDNTPHNGSIWGDPNEKFVGNVNGRQMVNGYGVHWGPIARVASSYRRAEAFEGSNLQRLTVEIKNGNPVLVWVFSNRGVSTTWYTPGGKQIYAVRDEHSVVVVGFTGPAASPTQLIINDPLIGQVYWSRSWFEKKWGIFNRSGVIIY